MEITIDISEKTVNQLMAATDSDNEEVAIIKAIDFTNDRY